MERTERTYHGEDELAAGITAMEADGWRVVAQHEPRALPRRLGVDATIVTFEREAESE
jgi:hypothetical protein